MKAPQFVSLLTFASCLSLACGDDGTSDVDSGTPVDTGTDAGVPDTGAPDTGVDAGEEVDAGLDPNACRATDQFIPSGGSGGGPIDGETVVHTILGADDSLIEGVVIVLEDGNQRWEATTGADGCVRFAETGLSGPLTLSAFKDGYVFITIVGHDAAKVTMPMGLIGATPPTPALATVTGEVMGWDVLTTTTSSVARIVAAGPIRRSVFGTDPQQPSRAANMNVGAHIAVVGANRFDFTDYSILVDPTQTVGLWFNAGRVEIPLFGNPEFFFSHIGILTGLAVDEGETLSGQDVSISLPLSETVTLSHGPLPPGAPSELMGSMIEFADYSGVFVFGFRNPSTDTEVFSGPPLSGPLAGAGYGGVLEAVAEDGSKVSLVIRHGSPSPNIDFGTPPSPPGIAVSGRTLTATVSAQCDDLGFFLIGTGDQAVWVVQLNDLAGLNPSVTLPSMPSGIEDPLSGTLDVTGNFRSFAVPFDLNDFANDQLNGDATLDALTVSRIAHDF